MTYTADLRDRLRAATGVCPTCHQPTGDSTRDVAGEIGVAHTTLWRFMRGKDITGRNIDKVEAWLAADPDPR